jgi:probable phosphoglycerate mutase
MAYSSQYIGDAASLLPSDLKTFFFIRHGLTSWNAQHLVQGSTDIPLAAAGEVQAIAARPILLLQPLKRVVSSPLTRASKTAELCIAGTGLEETILLEPRLKERGFGRHEGTIPSPDMFRTDWEDCEVTQDFSRRVAGALEHCREDGTLLVAHGGVLSVLLALLGCDVEEELKGNARALRFEELDGKWQVTALTMGQ